MMRANDSMAREGGAIIADAFFSVNLQLRMLNALFDAKRPMSASELETQLRCTRRDLWNAVRAQAQLGNIKKGQPIELTNSANIAIAAGRAASATPRAA